MLCALVLVNHSAFLHFFLCFQLLYFLSYIFLITLHRGQRYCLILNISYFKLDFVLIFSAIIYILVKVLVIVLCVVIFYYIFYKYFYIICVKF